MLHRLPLLALVALLALLAGCASSEKRELTYKDVEIDEYKRQIAELEEQLYRKDAAAVQQQLSGKDESVATIQSAVDPNTRVSTREVEVSFEVPSEVLFKSGSAQLTAAAKSSLNKVVAVIRERFPNHDIRVVGHTDDQKITRTKHLWQDNWDLSAARAREVLLYLESRGIPASRLGLAGYGDQRPLVPNTSEQNRQRNRRVEIIAIPPNAPRPQPAP
ncbi:MAG: OmpA family protein [Planctomycetota bacterium]|nr:OmpA family protein [Planctomycetota bacterium]MDW8373315.1 OmpA family protein [Planctomycetota bacterium]